MFGEIVRAHRQRLGVTQAELASRSGVSERSIRNIEAGQIARPRAGTVRQLADAFGLAGADRDDFCSAGVGGRTRQPVSWPRPAQMPADVADFSGRDDHLHTLTALFGERHAQVVVIVGIAGVGKTAFTVHWAHRIRDSFPGGQLYVDLRGHTAGPPLRPIDVLARFLRTLGVAPGRVPVDPDEAAALYRSLLADQRILVVLDNAAHSAQIRPLLPGRRGCLALVTSRDELTGLEARDGAHRLQLDPLSPDEAQSLLVRLLGGDRVTAEPDAATEMARLCGYLPLALRIAAANLSRSRRRSLAEHVDELATGNRLALLQVEDDHAAAVQAAFDLSYVSVPPAAQRMFRLLGLMPGANFTVDAAATLADVNPSAARQLLDRLVRANLVQLLTSGRYAFHDLLRLHARGCAENEEPESERDAAMDRLSDWYLSTARSAVELLYPQKLRLPGGVSHQPGFDSDALALDWLNAERANMVDMVTDAAEHRRPVAWQLADILRAYFFHTLHMVEWLTVARTADAAAAAEGNSRARAAAQLSLADLYWRRSEHQEATAHTMRALALAEDTGWLEGQAAVHGTLGGVCWLAGSLGQAVDHLSQALVLNRRTGRLAGQAINLSNLGLIHGERGQLALAERFHTEALEVHRQAGSNAGEAVTMVNLGEVYHLRGHLQQGMNLLYTAVARTHQVGDRAHEAEAFRCLAAVHLDLNHHREALDLIRSAQATLAGTEYRRGEADIANTLGEIHCRQGEYERAVSHHQHALDIARKAGDRYPETAALIGLATAHNRLQHLESATALAEEALRAARHAEFRTFEGHAHTVLADIDHSRGRLAEAVRQAETALHIHRETGHRLGEARALGLLGRLLNAAKDFTTATAHKQAAQNLFLHMGIPDGEA